MPLIAARKSNGKDDSIYIFDSIMYAPKTIDNILTIIVNFLLTYLKFYAILKVR